MYFYELKIGQEFRLDGKSYIRIDQEHAAALSDCEVFWFSHNECVACVAPR